MVQGIGAQNYYTSNYELKNKQLLDNDETDIDTKIGQPNQNKEHGTIGDISIDFFNPGSLDKLFSKTDSKEQGKSLFDIFKKPNNTNEKNTATFATNKSVEDLKKEYPVDANGDMTGDVQDKLVANYKNVEDFEKDVKAGKFNHVHPEIIDSLKRHIADNQTHSEFPVKQEPNTPKHQDKPGEWDNDIKAKVVNSYNNIADFDKDVQDGKFYYVSFESIDYVRNELMKK